MGILSVILSMEMDEFFYNIKITKIKPSSNLHQRQ
jgi:hypothetical protein